MTPFKQLSLCALAAGALAISVPTVTTHAASSKAAIDTAYARLDQSKYPGDSFLATQARLTAPFTAGTLKPQYTTATVDWVNYYRMLVGLNPVPINVQSNQQSQLAAAAMAAAKSNPGLEQHGLNNSTQPSSIPTWQWSQAKQITANSNLFFHTGIASPRYNISSLVADNYNLSGQDTGHRAWLLSSRLSTFGIGAAIGANQWRYVSQLVINPADYNRVPSKDVVAYPSGPVFPLQELTDRVGDGHPIPWSVYFSNDHRLNKKGLQATVTDLATHASQTVPVTSYADAFYGGYSDILTFIPSRVPLMADHQYQVTITGLGASYPNGYQYRFTLVNRGPASAQTNASLLPDTYQTGKAVVKYVPGYSIIGWQAPAQGKMPGQRYMHNQTVSYKARNYQNGTYWYQLTNGTWLDGHYLQTATKTAKAAKTVNYVKGYSVAVWNSPYANRKATGKLLKHGTAWRTFDTVTVNNTTWYHLGGNQWLDGSYLR